MRHWINKFRCSLFFNNVSKDCVFAYEWMKTAASFHCDGILMNVIYFKLVQTPINSIDYLLFCGKKWHCISEEQEWKTDKSGRSVCIRSKNFMTILIDWLSVGRQTTSYCLDELCKHVQLLRMCICKLHVKLNSTIIITILHTNGVTPSHDQHLRTAYTDDSFAFILNYKHYIILIALIWCV